LSRAHAFVCVAYDAWEGVCYTAYCPGRAPSAVSLGPRGGELAFARQLLRRQGRFAPAQIEPPITTPERDVDAGGRRRPARLAGLPPAYTRPSAQHRLIGSTGR
jgi:hypothetical protein